MAIVATGSKYFLEVFKDFKEQSKERFKDIEVHTVDVPLPVKTGHMKDSISSDENVNRILKYIYNNQLYDVIKAEVNESNISQLYAQAHICRCTRLLAELENHITNEILNPSNAIQFYLDSILVST